MAKHYMLGRGKTINKKFTFLNRVNKNGCGSASKKIDRIYDPEIMDIVNKTKNLHIKPLKFKF